MTARGFGTVYQPTYRDKKTGEVKTQSVWWIQYCRNGKVIRESSESTKEANAWKLLKQRHGEMAAGKPVGPDVNPHNVRGLGNDAHKRLQGERL